jgi:hypothetical protein
MLIPWAVFFALQVILSSQPKQDFKNITREDTPTCFGEDPVIVNIISMLRGKSPEDLRLIYQLIQRL